MNLAFNFHRVASENYKYGSTEADFLGFPHAVPNILWPVIWSIETNLRKDHEKRDNQAH